MSDQPVRMGIAGLGYAFGADRDVAATAAEYVDDPERVLQWGIRTYHRAADDVHATDLAAAAATRAMEQAGVGAEELDLVVLANSDNPEYGLWDEAAALAGKLGAERTQTLVLHEGCGAGVSGFFYVAATMALQPEVRTAVFAAVNRVSEFHRNRMNTTNSVLSDGAGAVVLRRDHPVVRWLASEQFTYPEYVDWLRTDYGGAVAPVAPADWTPPSGYERIQAHFDRDPRALARFLVARNERVHEAVDLALKRAGLTRADLDHVVYVNDSEAAVAKITDPLGVPLERSSVALAPGHGHMGAADQLVSLAQHLERGDLRSGDVVALCGMSTGMHWCATLLQI